MSEWFDQKSVNPESAAGFAECIADFARLIKKMQANRIKFVITQQADQCDEMGLKVSTKLTLKNDDSLDEVDVVVAEKGVFDDETPLIEIGTNMFEFMRCYLVMNFSHLRYLPWDKTICEVAELEDGSGIMKELKHHLEEVTKIVQEERSKRKKAN